MLKALKISYDTGKGARRKNSPKMSGSHGDGYIDLYYFLLGRQSSAFYFDSINIMITIDDALANDWEVQGYKVKSRKNKSKKK